MTLYFAYGCNMDCAAMGQRCPRAKALGPAMLPGWRFFISTDGYASLARAPGAAAHGVLWRLGAGDLAALDAYENLSSGLYRRVVMPLRIGRNSTRALTYLGRARAQGRPKWGYLEAVLDAARDWDLPDDYIASLERCAPAARAAGAGR